jgi:hypothetical protein
MRFFVPAQSLLLLASIQGAFTSPIIKEQRPLLSGSSEDPYTPSYRDQYDHKVDSVGDDLDPLPYRNGYGASILGPQNKDRTRQNPDLMRPPSTDHGDMKNMRWSYADSHVRIEVRIVQIVWEKLVLTLTRKVDGLGRQQPESCRPQKNLRV